MRLLFSPISPYISPVSPLYLPNQVLAMRLLFVLPLTQPIQREPQPRPPRPAAGLGTGKG